MSATNARNRGGAAGCGGETPAVSTLVVSYNAVSCGQIDAMRLAAIFDGEPRVPFEVVAVDNGSEDGSGSALVGWAEAYPRLTVVRLERRIPLVEAIGVAADAARGSMVLLVDIDELDHLRLLGDLLEGWRGHEVLHGLRATRTFSTGRFLSAIFNAYCRLVLGFRMRDVGHHHFLMSRTTFDRLRAGVEEKRLFSYTFAIERARLDVVEVPVPNRPAGRSSYRFGRRARYVSRAVFEAARTRFV